MSHIATVPRDLKALAATIQQQKRQNSTQQTSASTDQSTSSSNPALVAAESFANNCSDDDDASTRDVYLERRPWHDGVLEKWIFTKELESRWEEIRAEFDALRAKLAESTDVQKPRMYSTRDEKIEGGVSQRPTEPSTEKNVSSASINGGLLLLNSSDEDVPAPDLAAVRESGALLPKIHPWPETNLYEQRAPRYVRETTSKEDASQEEKLVDQRRKRRQANKGATAEVIQQAKEEEEEALKGQGWDVFGIYAFGKKHHNNAKLCPVTTSIVEKIPGCSTAAFSILKPGARILPHTGYYGYAEMILRCHLGLHVPANEAKLWLQVAGVRRGWEEGRVFVFDDTYEHSAVNLTDQERIVLLLDFRAGRFDAETLAAMAERQTSASQHQYLENLVTSYGYGVRGSDDDEEEDVIGN